MRKQSRGKNRHRDGSTTTGAHVQTPAMPLKISRKEREAKGKKKKEEQSLDDEDIYEGFKRGSSQSATFHSLVTG